MDELSWQLDELEKRANRDRKMEKAGVDGNYDRLSLICSALTGVASNTPVDCDLEDYEYRSFARKAINLTNATINLLEEEKETDNGSTRR